MPLEKGLPFSGFLFLVCLHRTLDDQSNSLQSASLNTIPSDNFDVWLYLILVDQLYSSTQYSSIVSISTIHGRGQLGYAPTNQSVSTFVPL